MVGTPHRDHFRAGGITLGKFQGTLHGLGSRIKEIYRIQRLGQALGQQTGILHLRTLNHLAIDHNMHIISHLTLHGLHNGTIAVADIIDRHARNQIVVGFALGSIEKDSLGSCHLD